MSTASDGFGRLASSSTNMGQPNTAGSVAFTYDANGNLATEATWNGSAYAVSTTYSYDIENRLVGRSHATGNVTLSYDPLGRLYEVTGSSGATRFLYDGDALVAEYNASGAMTRRYVHNVGADVPMLSYAGSGLGQPTYLHADHQGSIVAVSDSAGAGTINTYDEYGIPGLGNTGRFQYTGQIWLDELGLYYYKARVYSPTFGRFLQIDPIGYDDQYNLYAYVGNDPVNNRDPTGRWTCAANSAAQCDTVAEGLRRARVALTRMRGADAARLRRSLAAWGARGVRNGVVVQSAANINYAMSTETRGGVTTVKVNAAIDTYAELQSVSIGSGAAAVAHEGVHIDDQRNKFGGSNPRTRQEYYDSQRRAYRVQGEVDRALGVESQGRYPLWRSNWGPSQEARKMNDGAFRATWDGVCRPNCNGIEEW